MMNYVVKEGLVITQKYIPCHGNNTLHLHVGFLFPSWELYKVVKYVYDLFTDGGTKAEDSK